MNNPLFIRADASAWIGIGHVMRCIALGQAWRGCGGDVVFITSLGNSDLAVRLRKEGFSIYTLEGSYPSSGDWDTTCQVISEYREAWVVLDGYHFDYQYHHRIRTAGHKLLVVDDNVHLPSYDADIILNQNVYASALSYPCSDKTWLLLGLDYLLLRDEFCTGQSRDKLIPGNAQHILVTMGGSDPDNVTQRVLSVLSHASIHPAEIKVVVGPANPHLETLEQVASLTGSKFEFLSDVNNMPALMEWADLCITAAGSTVWELAFMGVPMLVVSAAHNQVKTANHITGSGIGLGLGWYADLETEWFAQKITELAADPEQRRMFSENGRALIGNEGSKRVVEQMLRYSR